VEDTAKQRLADDDSSQTNDDGTTTHADIREALILAQQRAGQGHQTIGNGQAQHDVKVGVDALCPGHCGVGTGGADAAAQLGTEEPIQDADDHGRDDEHHNDGVVEGSLFDPAQGDEKVIFIHIDGLVCLAHDLQVDGVEGQLGQDACQDGRDPHESVEQAGDKARCQACHQSRQQRDPDVLAREQAHDANRAARAKGAIHGQVRHIQDAIGQVNANGHNAPDKALRTGAGQRTGQVCQSCKCFQNNSS